MKFSNQKLIKYSKSNRKQMTTAEAILWKNLRANSLEYKFRRQHHFEKYILDFVCLSKKLVIEIDGMSHDEINYDYDVERQKFIESKGFKVMRFSEFDVKTRIDEVMEGIYFELTSTTSTLTLPSP